MGLKQHTIIFVPHARARFRKWRVTNRQLAIIASTFALLLIASLFTTWSFFTSTVDRKELERVRTENQELRLVNRNFEESIRTLEKQLGEFEEQTRRLGIVAGLESANDGQGAGIGGDGGPLGSPASTNPLETLQGRSFSLAGALSRVERKLTERQRWIASTPAIAPVRGILTSGFGYRRDPMTGRRALHQGVDISTAPGRPVRAAADGIVLRSGRIGGLGKAVYLSHGYGLVTRYGHLSEVSVSPGDRIRRGDTLGFVGSTGKSTGYHLHYEVREDGKAVNPIAYLLESPS